MENIDNHGPESDELAKAQPAPESSNVVPESGLEGEVGEQIDRAQEILGSENVLGPAAVETAFGIHLSEAEIPPIPFSRDDLVTARRLKQMLVLRVSLAADGEPLTMEKIAKVSGRASETEVDEAGLLSEFYQGQPFRTEDVPTAAWALIGRRFVPNTTHRDHTEQFEELANYIREDVFCDRDLPDQYRQAIEELERLRATWVTRGAYYEGVTNELTSLQISRLTLPTAVESMYDHTLYASIGNTTADFTKSEHPICITRTLTTDNMIVYADALSSKGPFNILASPLLTPLPNYGVSISRSQ